MSPILVRPVREQLEHDRVIRLLQQDLQKRKVEVGINPGAEQNASVGTGSRKEFPDAVVYSLEKGKKVVAVVEVETGESVNHLEAMAQWAHLAKLRVPFHLYVPINSIDVARRLSRDYKIAVTEIWSYHQVGEQFKFTLIHPVSSSRGGRAATPPRTVSVATIRVALPPEPEPPAVEEPLVRTEPAPTAKPSPKVQVAKTIPAKTVLKASIATVPRVVPVKAVAKPAPIKAVSARPVAEKPRPTTDKVPATKALPAGPSVSRPLVVKPAVKAAGKGASKAVPLKASAAKATPKPAAKAAAKNTIKSAGRSTPRAVAPKVKPPPKSTANRLAVKPARPAARSTARPVAKRK